MEGKSVTGGVSSAGDLVASGLFTAEMVRDFDPEVILDDLQDDSTGLLSPSPLTSSSTNSNSHSEHSQGVQAIQMAAKMVRIYLYNHLQKLTHIFSYTSRKGSYYYGKLLYNIKRLFTQFAC